MKRCIQIDWRDLFRQAGIAPRRCKVGRSLVADAWCLFLEDAHGLELVVIKPPPAMDGETGPKIENGFWVYETPTPSAPVAGKE